MKLSEIERLSAIRNYRRSLKRMLNQAQWGMIVIQFPTLGQDLSGQLDTTPIRLAISKYIEDAIAEYDKTLKAHNIELDE